MDSSLRKLALACALLGLCAPLVLGQSDSASQSNQSSSKPLPSDPLPHTQSDGAQPEPEQTETKAPPVGPGDSSSRQQIIDISPPENDDREHPDSELPDNVQEFHAYDPHKAAKSLEIGDFYFKRKNYKAAIERYREAVGYKPDDALSTFHLARALEESGNYEEARKEYQAYLKILPHGPSAGDAHRALEKLQQKIKASGTEAVSATRKP